MSCVEIRWILRFDKLYIAYVFIGDVNYFHFIVSMYVNQYPCVRILSKYLYRFQLELYSQVLL